MSHSAPARFIPWAFLLDYDKLMEVMMRKSLYIFFVLVVGWLMTVGLTCEKRNVEVPVLNSAATPIEVNTSNNSYSEDGVYDAYDDVDQIREDNDFDRHRRRRHKLHP